jgi:quercetin dioxygenase-like cupin family protein
LNAAGAENRREADQHDMGGLTNMSAKIVTAEEGTRLNLMGDAVRIILRSEETGGSLSLVQQRSLPGAGIPLHINTREDEVFQVLEGRVEFQVGEETITAETGTVVHVPKNLPHSFLIVGADAAVLQIMMLPGGLEKRIEEIIQLPKPPEGASVAAICERYGVRFLHH